MRCVRMISIFRSNAIITLAYIRLDMWSVTLSIDWAMEYLDQGIHRRPYPLRGSGRHVFERPFVLREMYVTYVKEDMIVWLSELSFKTS